MARYIHERSDWHRFRRDSAKLATPLAALRHKRGRLIGRMEALGFALRDEAALRTLTEEVVRSSEIEGDALDRAQVRSSIARRLGLERGAIAPVDRKVGGVVEIALDATEKYDAPLDAERLFAWRATLFPTGRSGVRKIFVGGWRKDLSGPVQVVSGPVGRERVHYEAPPAARLKKEIKTFLRLYNGGAAIDPVLKGGSRISGS